jgi:hypothetical protein
MLVFRLPDFLLHWLVLVLGRASGKGSMTLAIGWLHDGGDSVRTWAIRLAIGTWLRPLGKRKIGLRAQLYFRSRVATPGSKFPPLNNAHSFAARRVIAHPNPKMLASRSPDLFVKKIRTRA